MKATVSIDKKFNLVKVIDNKDNNDRPMLQTIHISGKVLESGTATYKACVADGFMLAEVPAMVTVGEVGEEVVPNEPLEAGIPLPLAKSMYKGPDKNYASVDLDEGKGSTEVRGGGVVTVELDPGGYPDTDAIFGDANGRLPAFAARDRDGCTVAVNARLLYNLAQAMGTECVCLYLSSKTESIGVLPALGGDGRGVLMPVNLNGRY